MYRIAVSGMVSDGRLIPFTVHAVGDGGSWNSAFSLPAQAPVLQVGGLRVNDAYPLGDGNGVPDPGENFALQIAVRNVGHSDTGPLTAALSCQSAYISIPQPGGACPGVPWGDESLFGGFQVEVSSDCPHPTPINFRVEVAGESGFSAALDFLVDIGGWLDDVETDRGWTLGAEGDNATTGHWVRVDPIGTVYNGQPCAPEDDHTAAPGTMCFVTGNGVPGGAAGDSDLDGGRTTLLSPIFALADATDATLSYWRWYTNHLGNNPNQDWWTVEVTSDGTTWVRLERTTDSANSWNPYSFNLRDHITLTDRVQVRFIADDTSPGSLVEAAVDDLIVYATFTPSASTPDPTGPGRAGILSLGPNPSNRGTSIVFSLERRGRTSLELYDVSGRKVRSLVNGEIPAGVHRVSFEGRDDSGRSIPSGVYFLRLHTPDFLQVQQITVLK